MYGLKTFTVLVFCGSTLRGVLWRLPAPLVREILGTELSNELLKQRQRAYQVI